MTRSGTCEDVIPIVNPKLETYRNFWRRLSVKFVLLNSHSLDGALSLNLPQLQRRKKHSVFGNRKNCKRSTNGHVCNRNPMPAWEGDAKRSLNVNAAVMRVVLIPPAWRLSMHQSQPCVSRGEPTGINLEPEVKV